MKKSAVLSFAAIVAVSFTAVATEYSSKSMARSEHMKQRFTEVDTNSDGVVTHDEMMAKVAEKFAEFDKNGDGYLELAELPKIMPVSEHMEKRMKMRQEKMKKRMERRGEELEDEEFSGRKRTRLRFVAKLDKDGDERVSLDEFARKPTRFFKRGDVNGDGQVTLAELEEAKEHHKKKRGKERRHRHG